MVKLPVITIALMAALAYEMVLKFLHLISPSLFNVHAVSGVTSLLTFLVGCIIVLFLLSFYNEERSDRNVALILKILLAFFIVAILFRLPIVQNLMGFQTTRLFSEMIGSVVAICLFVLIIFYGKSISAEKNALKQAAVFLTVMLGIGMLKSIFSSVLYVQFVVSGAMTDPFASFYAAMTILFFITHASMIYFLYRYYQVKLAQ
jgi:CDP-diglyceride synthetase